MGDQENFQPELHPSAPAAAGEKEHAEPVEGTQGIAGEATGKASMSEMKAATPSPSVLATQSVPPKDPLSEEIQDILSEDLVALYKQMPPDEQHVFKAEGEKTAGLIRQMFAQGKVHARRIVGLIRAWLKLIPGVNRFFLAQEAKIKTDKILQIAEENKNDVSH